MLEIKPTSQFKKDLKVCKKRNKDLNKLSQIVETLASEEELDQKHKPLALSGNWSGFWECHIEPDWLLIYQQTETLLILARTGTHSDLF
jgi:mRNA interferase YafQ